jgi:hypothetical protein
MAAVKCVYGLWQNMNQGTDETRYAVLLRQASSPQSLVRIYTATRHTGAEHTSAMKMGGPLAVG